MVDLLVLGGPVDDEADLGVMVTWLGAQGVGVRHLSITNDLSAAALLLQEPGEVALAVVEGSVLVSGVPLGALYDDPRLATAALALPGHRSLGLLRVDPADRPAAAEALSRIPTWGSTSQSHSAVTRSDGAGAVLALIRQLEAAGVPVVAVPLRGFAWAQPGDLGELARAQKVIAGVDERRTRLREAARGGDGFYSTFVLRKLSWHLTGVAERLGVTPNQVTVVSFLLGLVAAGLIATGDRPVMIIGAVLLQICLVVDCVDGELARYRRRFSRFGAWLDATTDRVKEFAAVAAFAVAGHQHGQVLWGLAAAAIILQTARNLADLGWAAQRGRPEVPASPIWVEAGTHLVTPTREPGAGATEWLRRIGHFPVGERFLVMSIGALVLPPRITLIVLLIAGALAGLYLLAAFAVRSRPGRAVAVGRLTDGGPLLRGVVITKRPGALAPAVIATVELTLAWLLTGGPAGLLVVAVIAIAHYQEAYGEREGQVMSAKSIGPEIRLPVLLVGALTGQTWVAATLAAVVAVTSTARSLDAWTEPS